MVTTYMGFQLKSSRDLSWKPIYIVTIEGTTPFFKTYSI